MSKGKRRKALVSHPDPVYTKWRTAYPEFPGVEICVEQLRKARGGLIDIICIELRNNARDNLDDLIKAFGREEDDWIQLMLLSSIADARIPEATPFLGECLLSDNQRFREEARFGLEYLDTKESRTILWNAESSEFTYEPG